MDIDTDQVKCETRECIATAADILVTLDQTVNPCDNFYNFACGGFANYSLLANGLMTVNQYQNVEQKILRQLYALISADVKADEIRPIRMAKHFFKSCMNRSRIEELGIKPLIALKKSLGGWPCVDGYDWDTSWNWIEMVRRAHETGLGMNWLFSLFVGPEKGNTSVKQLSVGF